MAKNKQKGGQSQYRFGIGEWYGRSFVSLTPTERVRLAELQFSGGAIPECPFTSAPCWKKGGVCSLRSYENLKEIEQVRIDQRGSTFRTICPTRFEQFGEIYRWIGEVVLNDTRSVALGQINFLERVPLIGGSGIEGTKAPKEVGRIDNVLVIPDSMPLQWCAVEIQAVYFSGRNMKLHFQEVREAGASLPFPKHTRRPDYRSSAPKRLMPQLQIKVPTLSRWGKKMAVVVDEDFFKAMGKMESVPDLSNCDVAWFVTRYREEGEKVLLERGEVVLTTLRSSVEGLIAGKPPAQGRFEEKIRERLPKS